MLLFFIHVHVSGKNVFPQSWLSSYTYGRHLNKTALSQLFNRHIRKREKCINSHSISQWCILQAMFNVWWASPKRSIVSLRATYGAPLFLTKLYSSLINNAARVVCHMTSRIYRVAQIIGTILYALTLPNINRFSKPFNCHNQEKM